MTSGLAKVRRGDACAPAATAPNALTTYSASRRPSIPVACVTRCGSTSEATAGRTDASSSVEPEPERPAVHQRAHRSTIAQRRLESDRAKVLHDRVGEVAVGAVEDADALGHD